MSCMFMPLPFSGKCRAAGNSAFCLSMCGAWQVCWMRQQMDNGCAWQVTSCWNSAESDHQLPALWNVLLTLRPLLEQLPCTVWGVLAATKCRWLNSPCYGQLDNWSIYRHSIGSEVEAGGPEDPSACLIPTWNLSWKATSTYDHSKLGMSREQWETHGP